jgi:HAD superfamily hydrolase (TIGR01509 family)
MLIIIIKAVIFDLDGVIYDSTPFTWKARNTYLEKYGIKIEEDEIREFLGRSFRDTLNGLNERYDLNLEFDDFSNKTREIAVNLMKDSLRPCDGVRELIDDLLKNDIKIAIASSNLKRFIEEDLEIMGLRSKFEMITSVEEVENHKPNPDIFLITAKKLNLQPEECVVIEDAVNGVKAAKRANMKVVAVLTKFHKREDFDKIADLIVDSLAGLNSKKIQQLKS